MNRVSGTPAGVRRGFASSWTTHNRTIQAASSHPLTSDHRPLTRYPPATTCACPEARVLFAVMTSGSAWMVRAASGASWRQSSEYCRSTRTMRPRRPPAPVPQKPPSLPLARGRARHRPRGGRCGKIQPAPGHARDLPAAGGQPRYGRAPPGCEAGTCERCREVQDLFLRLALAPSVQAFLVSCLYLTIKTAALASRRALRVETTVCLVSCGDSGLESRMGQLIVHGLDDRLIQALKWRCTGVPPRPSTGPFLSRHSKARPKPSQRPLRGCGHERRREPPSSHRSDPTSSRAGSCRRQRERQAIIDASLAVKRMEEDHSANAAIFLAFTRGRVRLAGKGRFQTQIQEDAR